MKIKNSSRITALILTLVMILPLISLPTFAETNSTSINNNTTTAKPVFEQTFDNVKKEDALAQYPYASNIVYGIGGSDSAAIKIEQKATYRTELAVLYTDRSGAKDVTAVEYADGREWTGIENYDDSAVKVTTSDGSGITGVITTAAKATNNVNSCTPVTGKGTYAGTKTLAIVEGTVANAICGNCGSTYTTIAREAYTKNPEVAITDEKVFVLEADYYVSADFSATIEGRVYGDAGQIDLFRIMPSGDNVKICKHTDCVDVKNGENGVTVAKGSWYNLKFVIDTTKGYPTIHCFVDDTYAFTTDESTNLADKTLTKLNANRWNLGHASRGVQASTLTGYWAVDNANIYTSTAGMKLTMWSNDVEEADAVSNIFYSYVPGNKISIDSTTFADTEHGDVIAWDNTPYADGSYWLYTGSGHFGANNNNKITNITVTEGKATGSVTVGETTYYFKDATVCTTGRTQVKATMYTDEACTTTADGTYYICNGAVVTAYTGGSGGNIATPSLIKPGLKGQKFTVSADYYFAVDLDMNGMDIRLHSPSVHMFSVGGTNPGDKNLTVKLHGDLSKAGNTNTIYSNNTLTISKGEWHNFTVAFDSTFDTAGTLITGYVDGKLVGSIFMATNEMTHIEWNVGHTTRNGNVSDNKGHWYMDNFAVYYGNVIPAEWTVTDSSILYKEDFELLGKTAVSADKTINYGGTLYESVDINGNKAIKIDTDTLKDDADQSTGVVANLDKNFIAKLPEGITHTAYESVVLEAAYFLESHSRQQIEAQLRYVTADCSSTFGGAGTNQTNVQWVQLYTIKHEENYAYFANFGASVTAAIAHTTYYNVTCPTGRWFTVSTVVNLKTGAMSFYVDGVLAATTYAYATAGADAAKNTFLTNIDLRSGTNGFIVAKLNSLKVNSVQAGYNGSWPKGYSGFFMVDDISIYTGTAPKKVANGISVDFEDAALTTDKTATSAGQIAKGENTIPTSDNKVQQFAPSLAVYEQLAGNWAVKFDMKGATADAPLANPFIAGFNSRAYDIKVKSDGSWTPVASGKVTWDMIEGDAAVLTKTSCILNSKPIYYYWDGGNTVHVYNNNGNAVTAENVSALKYSKVTLTDDNYKPMLRAMCGGSDANIDKNYYLNSPALTAAGTYVLSADYYIPENAGGIMQGQMYTNWVDLYRFDLTNKTFNSANSTTAVADIKVNAWNNVTILATVAADKDVVFDVYFNGVYTHTVTKADYKTIATNDWILFKATKPWNVDTAAEYAGNVYVDNVQINAVAYDENKLVDEFGQLIYVDVNGQTKLITNKSKFYNAILTNEVYFNVADYAGIVDTEAEAQVRLAANSGLRFATKINTELLDALKNDENIKSVMFGTLIAPERYLVEGVELTVESLTAAGQKLLQVEPTAIDAFYQGYDNDDATTHYVGSIVDILASNIGENFCARGYVKVELLSGEIVYIYSADYATRNVKEAATAIIAEVGAENLDEVYGAYAQILRNYAAGLQADAE